MKFEIGTTLQTKQPFQLDIANVITGRTFIASITRFGKSWTARKIVEKCFGHAGIVLLDVEGEYVSLREKFPFLIIGKDVPIQLETAEFLVDKIIDAKLSVIIDFSKTEEELGKEYMDKFLRRLFFLETTLRLPYLIIAEEAEDEMPEKGIATATCLDIFRNLAKKGGKRGIGLMVIAHRPAWVNKGVLSQCENKAIGRMDWPADLGVIEEYLRIPKKTIEKLPDLDKGEFLFAGDWVEKPTFVKVGQVETTHLGYTPDVVPPSPKELQGVLLSLQKSLPEVIEKIKPTVVPIDQIKTQVKEEMEKKYQDKIAGIQRTADEKAERKYHTQIEQLKENNDKLSREATLQPTAPITSVFEHPIVRTRMTELSDKAKDLLIKIDQEPNLTRQQLAAFLTTSTDAIAILIDKINKIFKAKVLVGEGKPMQYKSQLVYFFGGGNKKEVQELERLQREIRDMDEKNKGLQTRVNGLSQTVEASKRASGDLVELTKKHEKTENELKQKTVENERLIEEKKQFAEMGKGGAALSSYIDFVVDRKLAVFKPVVTSGAVSVQPKVDMNAISQMMDEKIKNLPTPLLIQSPNSEALTPIGDVATSITLEHKITHFDFQKQEEHVKANTTDIQGRIIYLITKGFFDRQHNPPEVTTELANNGWTHDKKDVTETLVDLCQLGILRRAIGSAKYWWYSLTPEAKERIHT